MGSFFGRRHAANDPYADTIALVVVNCIVGYKSEPTSRAKREWQATFATCWPIRVNGVLMGEILVWPRHRIGDGQSVVAEPKLDVT